MNRMVLTTDIRFLASMLRDGKYRYTASSGIPIDANLIGWHFIGDKDDVNKTLVYLTFEHPSFPEVPKGTKRESIFLHFTDLSIDCL